MVPPTQTKNLFANYKASLQDLQALEIFTKDQTTSFLCIGKDGHFWTQNRNADFFTQFFQWIYRSLFEKSFNSEQGKVNYLINRVHWNLGFVEEIGIFAGLDEEDIKEIRSFNKIVDAHSLQNDNLSEQFRLALRVMKMAWEVLNAKENPEDLAPRGVLLRLEQTDDPNGDDFEEVEELELLNIVPETFLKESPLLKLDIDDLVKQSELFLSEENAQKFREVVDTVINHYLSSRDEQVAQRKLSIDFFRKLDANLNQKTKENPNDPNLKKQMICFCIFAEEELRRLRECSRNESGRKDEIKELHDLETHFRITSQVVVDVLNVTA